MADIVQEAKEFEQLAHTAINESGTDHQAEEAMLKELAKLRTAPDQQLQFEAQVQKDTSIIEFHHDHKDGRIDGLVLYGEHEPWLALKSINFKEEIYVDQQVEMRHPTGNSTIVINLKDDCSNK